MGSGIPSQPDRHDPLFPWLALHRAGLSTTDHRGHRGDGAHAIDDPPHIQNYNLLCRIYESDGKYFVESGETRQARRGEMYLDPISQRWVVKALADWGVCATSVSILQEIHLAAGPASATPEARHDPASRPAACERESVFIGRAAESVECSAFAPDMTCVKIQGPAVSKNNWEGMKKGQRFEMDGKLYEMTSDTECREVARQESCPYCGEIWHVDEGCHHKADCTYLKAFQAARIGDIPNRERYKTCKEYADENWRKYAAGAGERCSAPSGQAQISSTGTETPNSTAQPTKAPEQTKAAAAQPAILPTWTDEDCMAFMDSAIQHCPEEVNAGISAWMKVNPGVENIDWRTKAAIVLNYFEAAFRETGPRKVKAKWIQNYNNESARLDLREANRNQKPFDLEGWIHGCAR